MNDRYHSLATQVDPAKAEALRRQLHARLTAAGHEAALITSQPDPDNSEEETLMSIEELDKTDQSRRPRAFAIGAGIVLAIAAVVAVAVVVSDDDPPSTADQPAATGTAAPPPTAALPTAPPPTAPLTTAPAPTTSALVEVSSLVNSMPLAPGTYAVDPDLDPTTRLRVLLDVPAGWLSWTGAYKEPGDHRLVVSITTIANVTADACTDQTGLVPAVGPTVDDLAAALADLSPFQVTSPPSDVTIFGYSGKHLELAVPEMRLSSNGTAFADCVNGNLMSWMETPAGGFYAYNPEAGSTEEFWILDVDGTRLMISAISSPSASPQDVAEMQAIVDSIRIEP